MIPAILHRADVITARYVAEIDRKLADLTALRGELVRRLDRCQGPTIAGCRIIEALSPQSGAT